MMKQSGKESAIADRRRSIRSSLQATLDDDQLRNSEATDVKQLQAQMCIRAFFRCLTVLREQMPPSLPLDAVMEPADRRRFSKDRVALTQYLDDYDFLSARQKLLDILDYCPVDQDAALYLIAMRQSGTISEDLFSAYQKDDNGDRTKTYA